MPDFQSLPDDLLRSTICFCSAKTAACVKILARDFRNLFNIVPTLAYCEPLGSAYEFTTFVTEASKLHESTRVKELSIELLSTGKEDHSLLLRSCLRHVCGRGVMCMVIKIDAGFDPMPSEIFSVKSLTDLEIGSRFRVASIPETASLPELKTLILSSVLFDPPPGETCCLKKILCCCPKLKLLKIHDLKWELWNWEGQFSSPSLTDLYLDRELDSGFDEHGYTRISFNLPNLLSLTYSDYVPDEYGLVRLDSLVEAKICLLPTVNHIFQDVLHEDDLDQLISDPTEFILGLGNVKSLLLSTPYTLMVFNMCRHTLPQFTNLVELEIDDPSGLKCWRFFPLMVANAPMLKRLIITLLHSTSECACLEDYTFLYGSVIEEVQVQCFYRNHNVSELKELSHFIFKCSRLRLLKLHCPLTDVQRQKWLREDLESLVEGKQIEINLSFP